MVHGSIIPAFPRKALGREYVHNMQVSIIEDMAKGLAKIMFPWYTVECHS